MIISSNSKIEYILRQFTESIVLPKTSLDMKKHSSTKPVENSVTISDEGKKKMRERFQNDAITYLRNKY